MLSHHEQTHYQDLVYTVPDRHEIKFDSLKMSVPCKFMIMLQNLILATIIEFLGSGKSKHDHKLPELDVVSMRHTLYHES